MGLMRILALAMVLWVDVGYEEESMPIDPWASPTPSEPVDIPSWDGAMEV